MDTRRVLFLLVDQRTAGASVTPQVALKANGKRLKSIPMTNYDKDIWMAIVSLSDDQCTDLRYCTGVSGRKLSTLEENWVGIKKSLFLHGDVVVLQKNRKSAPVIRTITPIAVQNMNTCFFNLAPKAQVSSGSTTVTHVLGNSPGLGSWQPEHKPFAFHVAHGLSCVPVRIDDTSRVQFKLVTCTDWTTELKWEPEAFVNKSAYLRHTDPGHVRLVISEWGDTTLRFRDVPVYSGEEVPPAPMPEVGPSTSPHSYSYSYTYSYKILLSPPN